MLPRVLITFVSLALTYAGAAEAAKLHTLATIPLRLDGGGASSGLTNVNGTLYGATYRGGLYGQGTIFTIDPATGSETVVYSFPAASPGGTDSLLYAGGLLYGVADTTLFSFNPTSGTFSQLHVFPGQGLSHPAIQLTPVGSLLYGNSCIGGNTIDGFLFSYDPSSSNVTTVYSFNGASNGGCPTGALVNAGGLLYGATEIGGTANAGTLFSFNPSNNTETVLYSFQNGADGAAPASLVQVGSLLYGKSATSVVDDQLFSFNPATAQLTILYKIPSNNFCAGNVTTSLLPLNKKLYLGAQVGGAQSSCGGELLAFDPATNTVTTAYAFPGAQANYPSGSLVPVGTTLYGTSAIGGPILGQDGDAFKVDLTNGIGTVLHTFVRPDGGSDFTSTLLRVGKLYYGVSAFGGDNDRGALFSFDPVSHALKVLHAFNGMDGSNPHGDLLYARGAIWGTTIAGGSNDAGTIFTVDLNSGAESVAYSFASTPQDGAYPRSGLIDLNATFYGTTASGGAHGNGTIYAFHPANGHEDVLHAFAGGSDGTVPSGSLTVLNSLLYGTTQGTFSQKKGTLFSFDPTTRQENVLINFDGTSHSAPAGATPYAGVTAINGLLYGTTHSGGSKNDGVVFSFDPLLNTENVIYSFVYSRAKTNPGIFPEAPLTAFGANLLGSTSWLDGTEFSLDPATGTLTTEYRFTGGSDGAQPTSALTARGTTFLGTTSTSNIGNIAGTVFSLAP